MKKIAFFVLFSTLFSYAGILNVEAQFSGAGLGTVTEPYQITGAAQLNEVRNNLSAYYKLMNNIDITEWLTTNSPANGWNPISTFTGNFDGGNHVISGLWINRSTADNTGLFGQASGIIRNLGIQLASKGVLGGQRVAGLIGGIAGNLTVSKCFVTGNVTGTGSRAGGLIGGDASQHNYIILVQNCYFAGNVTAPADPVGGIIGGGFNGTSGSYTIENCYAAGKVTSTLSTGSAGAIVGNWTFTTGSTEPALNISRCFALISTLKGKTSAIGRIHGWVKAATQVHLANNSAYNDMQVYAGATGTEGNLISVTGTATNQNGASKTLQELSTQSAYTAANWDFTTVWQIGNGSYQFPVLKDFSLNLQPSTALSFTTSQFEIPAILSDNMILQRNSSVHLWGKAPSNAHVNILTSWNQANIDVTASADGNWETIVTTGNAGGPYNITISSEDNTKTINNVLLGEVWICAGQSNMAMPLKGWDGMPVEGSAAAIAESAAYSDIRMFTVTQATSLEKQWRCSGAWQLASTNAETFSAAGYFYALELRKKLSVPIGMVHLSWPGSTVQAWTSREVLQLYPEVNLNISGDLTQRTPTVLYNAMFNPVSKYSVKGVLWYQGEDNVSQASLYAKLFPAFMRNWRNVIGQGEIPFYYVQLAPYKYQGSTQNLAAQLREVQLQTLDSLNNIRMITTGDLGEEENIHPAKKKEIAQRLSYWSLQNTYGYNEAPYTNIATPVCIKKIISGNKIILEFKNNENGLVLQGTPQNSFEIAGSNGTYYTANAQVVENRLEVSAAQVSAPKNVRYAFKNYYTPVFFNNFGIPVSPFRTENIQEGVTSTKSIKENNVKIFPNPAKEELRIENGEWRMENITITDFTGKKLSTFNIQPSTSFIDISALSAGVYFITIEGKTQKFVKM